eukprot:TRINITY_DN18210_c0_g1_i1.p1 TRINITY_DN18210_c0_g1~~TRINITY_DN18210_c0_g1_i1.p1  ORF type:complete len:152 (-),score=28.18 TRINITY_DN18210_c0_g1_i1:65-520(-)
MGAVCCSQEEGVQGNDTTDEPRAAVDTLKTLVKPSVSAPYKEVPASLQPLATPSSLVPASSGFSLVVTFEVPGTREVKQVVFARRPLGLDFDKVAPVSMKRVHRNGHAEELGVEKGWIVKAVNGIDVIGKDFPAVHELLVKECALLPHDVP